MNNATPIRRHTYSRSCGHCRTAFKTWNKGAKYCSERCRTDASTARRDRRPNNWKTTPRECRRCGLSFLPPSPNRRYCGLECAAKARRRDLARFVKENPDAQAFYNRNRKGGDTLFVRVMKKYPHLPRACQAAGCGESRVLDLAHRPEFRRNGAWRTIERYQPHMIWILCPTCHRVLDMGVETPEQMGLA